MRKPWFMWCWALAVLGACGGQGGDGIFGLPSPTGVCGTGSWRPGDFAIHHIDVGQGDATLVVTPSGRTLLIDAGETRWDGRDGAVKVGQTVRDVLGCMRLDHVVLTHFHLDHVGFPRHGGLWDLVFRQGVVVGTTWHRDVERYVGDAGATWFVWRDFLRSAGAAPLHPQVARLHGDIDLGPGVQVTIVAVDGNGQLRPGDFHR